VKVGANQKRVGKEKELAVICCPTRLVREATSEILRGPPVSSECLSTHSSQGGKRGAQGRGERRGWKRKRRRGDKSFTAKKREMSRKGLLAGSGTSQPAFREKGLEDVEKTRFTRIVLSWGTGTNLLGIHERT